MWWSARHPCQAQTKRLRLHDRSDNYLDTHRPAQISRFRKILGEAGVEQLLKTTIEAAVAMKAVKKTEF